MPLLHEPSVHASILRRLGELRADSRGRWGRMSVDQMLWHVNEALEAALGHVTPDPVQFPLPRPVLRLMVLNLPWMKGAPTNPKFLATSTHDFGDELARCRRLITELIARPLQTLDTDHPVLGRLTGRAQSRLQAKHLDHHLRQFGV